MAVSLALALLLAFGFPESSKGQQTTCVNSLDVVFLFDDSGSVNDLGERSRMIRFVRDVAASRRLDVASSTRMAMVAFSTKAQIVFDFTLPASLVDNAIELAPFRSGQTNLADGFRVIQAELLSAARGDRFDVGNVVVLVSDGRANTGGEGFYQIAEQLKRTGSTIISVFPTRNHDISVLSRLASGLENYIAMTREALEIRLQPLYRLVCTAAPPLTCIDKADVVFVVDGSGSIKTRDVQDWNRMLQFVNSAIDVLRIGYFDVRVAHVVFSSETFVVFNLTTYSDRDSMKRAVTNTPYPWSRTNIAQALKLVRTTIFVPSAGDRPNSEAPNWIILLTDSEQNEEEVFTLPEADLLKRNGVNIITIGVSNAADPNLLRSIASRSSYALSVARPSELPILLNRIISNDCPQASTPAQACRYNADILLVVDSSGSIKYRVPENWGNVIYFMQSFIRQIGVDRNAVKISQIVFSRTVELYYNFNRYTTEADYLRAVERTPYFDDHTDIGGALRLANALAFQPSQGDRAGNKDFLILLTDGKPDPSILAPDVDIQANILKQRGVEIISIGVTDNVDATLLRRIASSANNYYQVNHFEKLPNLVQDIVNRPGLCNDITPTPPTPFPTPFPTFPPPTPFPTFPPPTPFPTFPPPTPFPTFSPPTPFPTPPTTTPRNCDSGADVAFLLDASSSIRYYRRQNWDVTLNFLVNVMTGVFRPAMHFAEIVFSNNAVVHFPFRSRRSEEITNLILSSPYPEQETNLPLALQTARLQLFGADGFNGRRSRMPGVVILVTDGKPEPHGKYDTLTAEWSRGNATLLKNTGVSIFTVGVTRNIDRELLRTIASRPDWALDVAEPMQLFQLRDRLIAITCP